MRYLYILKHQKSQLMWVGTTCKDPHEHQPKLTHWKWVELLSTDSKTELLQVRTFQNSRSAAKCLKEFRLEHRVRTSSIWVNSDCYLDKNTPYVYLIRHRESGKMYIGVKYAKKANPSRFFKEYFTSSKIVIAMGWENFELLEIKATADAIRLEATRLHEAYTKFGRERFCDVFLNRNLCPAYVLDNETYARIGEHNRITMIGNTNGFGNKSHSGREMTETHRLNLSLSNLGNTKAMGGTGFLGRTHTEETKAKISRSKLGNTNAIGSIRSGEVRSLETRARISAGRKGKGLGRPWSQARRLAQLSVR